MSVLELMFGYVYDVMIDLKKKIVLRSKYTRLHEEFLFLSFKLKDN